MKYFVVVFTTVLLLFIGQYMIKDSVPASSDNKLYQEIVDKAKEFEKKPIDAKVDKIWKAIPAINGLEVDIEASYKKMKKKNKFDEKLLVFNQISPKVHLSDLTPEPIYQGNSEKKMIALTVNVAWGNEYLITILNALEKTNSRATFFLEGKWTENNPVLAKEIVKRGFEVGNHSYSHPDMATLSFGKNLEQLIKTNDAIKKATGQSVKWFAPPSGSFDQSLINQVKGLNMETILWTADTIDWQKPTAGTIINRITRKAENGTIVLMHPTAPSAQAIETLINKLKDKGYEIVDITTLLDETRE